MKRITFSLLLGILLVAVLVVPVLAGYYADLTVTEANGNAYTQVGLLESVDIDYLADNGYISSTGLDTRVTSGGTAIPHMLVDDSVMFVADVEAYGTLNLLFETGETALSSFPVIVGDGGYVTITDHADVEIGDDFEIEFEGYVDTAQLSYPVIEDTATSSEDSQKTSHTVTLPSSIASGDLLIILFAVFDTESGDPVITKPDGWTELDEGGQANVAFEVCYKVASGAEGSSVTVTTTDSGYSAHTAYRISNYQGTPEISAAAGPVSSANPDADNLGPSWGDSADTLWITACGWGQSNLRTVSAYPTDYSNGVEKQSSAGYAGVGSASREFYADAEDAGAFTLSGAAVWYAFTVGVEGYPNKVGKSKAFEIYVSDTNEISSVIYDTTILTVTASGFSSDEYVVTVWADSSNFGIDIDASNEDSTALGGVSTPDTGDDWIISSGPYYNYYTHTTSSTLRITYEPDSIIVGTTLPNEENPGTYDGTVTWGSNPAGVTVTLGGLVSDEQLFPAGAGADFPAPQDIAGPSGQPGITADVGTLTTNPLYPLVSMISDTTSLPVGIVWVMGATFILALLFVWMIGDQQMMHQMFIGIAGGGWVAFCWHSGIYPFWVIFIYAILAIAIVVGERSPTIS